MEAENVKIVVGGGGSRSYDGQAHEELEYGGGYGYTAESIDAICHKGFRNMDSLDNKDEMNHDAVGMK